MRSRPSPAIRPRRVLAVAGLVSLGTGLLMLTTAAPPAGASASSPAAGKHSLAARSSARGLPSRAAGRQFEAQVKQLTALTHADAVTHSPTTVTGPHMWDPSINAQNPLASTATISQTADMVNQMVQVSWTNFTPSDTPIYGQNTDYAVMVAECNGTNPASPADCYGAENAGKPGTSGPHGPLNTAYGISNSAGIGSADIQIQTKEENDFFGCQQNRPCSLVIVPAQGGNSSFTPAHCNDHTADIGFNGTGDAGASNDFGTNENDYRCSWLKRIVVPLTFARTAATCPFKSFTFSVEGSPMMDRAVNSWKAALCVGSHGLSFNYNSQVAEPQAITDAGSGVADVALTTRSASSQAISTGSKHFVYAPVGVSAVSVAYWFDNTVTGLPITNLRLNQRLLLKLLTQSYAFDNDGCPPASPGAPCDTGVDHNPISPFGNPGALLPGDQEFLQLNPEFASQNGQPPAVVLSPSSFIL